MEIFAFLKDNVRYLSCINDVFPETLAKKTMDLISMAGSDKIIESGLHLIKVLCSGNLNIIQLLLKDYHGFIQSSLAFQGLNIKLQVIALIEEICINR